MSWKALNYYYYYYKPLAADTLAEDVHMMHEWQALLPAHASTGA